MVGQGGGHLGADIKLGGAYLLYCVDFSVLLVTELCIVRMMMVVGVVC